MGSPGMKQESIHATGPLTCLRPVLGRTSAQLESQTTSFRGAIQNRERVRVLESLVWVFSLEQRIFGLLHASPTDILLRTPTFLMLLVTTFRRSASYHGQTHGPKPARSRKSRNTQIWIEHKSSFPPTLFNTHFSFSYSNLLSSSNSTQWQSNVNKTATAIKQDAALVQLHAGRSRPQGQAAVCLLPRGPSVGMQLNTTCRLTAGKTCQPDISCSAESTPALNKRALTLL